MESPSFVYSKQIMSSVRKAIDKYQMIADGDKIAVGVSGGKDSLSLLLCLQILSRYKDYNFSLMAIVIDSGFGEDYSPLISFFTDLNIDFRIIETGIAKIVFEERKERHPCSLCSTFRKYELLKASDDYSCTKLALGHNLDDLADTFFMNLINEGRIGVFSPVTDVPDMNLKVIRPLISVREKDIAYFVSKNNIPVIVSNCPANGKTERERVHRSVYLLDKEYRGLYSRIISALEKSQIDGFHR